MYAHDSFHTLTLSGQLGLVCLSLLLSAVLLFIAWWAMARRGPIARVGIAASLFYAFIWLSPQAYYTYYLTLFDDLPWQNVIKPPPPFWAFVDLLTFQDAATLSAHSQGLLGWMLLVTAAATPHLRRIRRRL